MDSTCRYLIIVSFSPRHYHYLGKTNAAAYELYGIFGEANGQSLPLGFIYIHHNDRLRGAIALPQQCTCRRLDRSFTHVNFGNWDRENSSFSEVALGEFFRWPLLRTPQLSITTKIRIIIWISVLF